MQNCSRITVAMATLLLALPAGASHYHRGPTSRVHKPKHRASAVARDGASRPRAIGDQRATEIQTALVKAGYLQNASGKWDEASADAMRKMQGDNGWQTKLIPDSRALIKLGLGPGSETTAPADAGGGLSEVTNGTAEIASSVRRR